MDGEACWFVGQPRMQVFTQSTFTQQKYIVSTKLDRRRAVVGNPRRGPGSLGFGQNLLRGVLVVVRKSRGSSF
jgi:hypothetical protein